MRRTVAAMALWLAAATVGAGELEGTYVLPTESCGDYFFIPMEVHGDPERVLWMLLDTGASHTVIDIDSAERVAGESVEIGRHVRFEKLTAGELEFSGLRAKVMRLDHLQLAIGKHMDGILGFPTFRELLLTIDYPAGEVRVRSGALPRPDGKRILRTIKEKRRPVVELDFDGHRRPVLIDSGAWGGFVLQNTEAIDFMDAPVVFDSSLRIDRVMLKSGARLRGDMRLATATLANPTVQLAESIELVGAEVLHHFSLTFDQKRRRVLFERAGNDPIEFPPLRDFGWSVRTRPGGYEILRVFEGFGASRAGVLRGDLVVEIEGQPVYERDRCKTGPELREQLAVTIERDGERLEFIVPIDTVVP